jgi:putative copper export protein
MIVELTAWGFVRFVHVLAATVWVGGQLMLTLVVMPAVRARMTVDERADLVHAVVRRYGVVANGVALPLLFATGIAFLLHREVTAEILVETSYGKNLMAKLGLVVLTIGLAAAHGILSRRNPVLSRALALASLAAAAGVVLFATALVP